MSQIPQARDRLMKVIKLLDQFKDDRINFIKVELNYIHHLMIREAPVRKALRSKRTTRDKIKGIKAYAEANPGADFMEIASRFDVSIARVSEILTGKKTIEDDLYED